jgi:hypothetical protein
MTPIGAADRCTSPRPPAALPDLCGPEHRPATSRVDDHPGEGPDSPMKTGTGQSALRLPAARTESRLSARAPDPPPLAQNDATSLRPSPGKITNDPAEIINTNPPPQPAAINTNTANSAHNTDPKTGLNKMLKGATTSPEGTVRLCQNQLPTTRAPSRAGRSPKHGEPSNEATETTTPTSGVKRKRQQPRAIRRRAFPARACARPTRHARGPADDHANSPIRRPNANAPKRRDNTDAARATRATTP